MDFIVKLPISEDPISGQKYDSIWVVIDRLTKYGTFVPCNESMDATQLAYLFDRYIASNHNPLKEIISDRGPIFVSKF